MKLILLLILPEPTLQYLEAQLIQPVTELEKPWKKHIQELIQLGVLRKVGQNEEVEVTTPAIISWHNEKSRMVGDLREFYTHTVPDRYLIPRIREALTQLSKAKFITSMDALKGFHQNVLTPKAKKLLRIITHCGIYEYLRIPFGIKKCTISLSKNDEYHLPYRII
ncbi:hypothetical protein O181_088910 [Austropuccinia psidii MF-1]|uniref:Reverse transcriptase domain-containing protein n=1 Tax=Austropuccinia psidii MF-1 TaxID=1389203 RepID=A0A9Q3ISB3_9BASI|nr:hypothetical protein [Austropuccinia psidii MF-1]